MHALPGTGRLSAFPLLTAAEFDAACRSFVGRVHAVGDPESLGWASVRWLQQVRDAASLGTLAGGEPFMSTTRRNSAYVNQECPREQPNESILKISKVLGRIGSPNNARLEVAGDEESQADQFEEDDNEALIRPTHPSRCVEVEYSILLSPTYQVPILYFTLRNALSEGPRGIEAIYRYLVPDQYKNELKSVGVMGGISMGYHPESGTPAYFVHPCNTAEALRDIAGGKDLDPETYLLIWLGLVGNCVNLHVPRQVSLAREGKIVSLHVPAEDMRPGF